MTILREAARLLSFRVAAVAQPQANPTAKALSFFSSLPLVIVLLVAPMLISCNGRNTSSPPANGTNSSSPPAIFVSIAPGSLTLPEGGVASFTASVSGSSNEAVFWSVQEGAAGGTITDHGVFTAPMTPGSFHVVATSQADTTKTAMATVTVPAISVTISPPSATLTGGETRSFTATVSGALNQAVTWQASGVIDGAGTQASEGDVSYGTISAEGVYTAPLTIPRPLVVTITATSQADTTKSASATVNIVRASSYSSMLTYRNDNARTGQNRNEVSLTPATVRSTTFGKLFSYPVDGHLYAQPLFVSGVEIPGQGIRNVVYAATEHDSVYAFDADGRTTQPLWLVSFIDPRAGVTAVSSEDVECRDLVPEIGITGTPVIDSESGTLYVVAKTKENGNFFHRLHALDIGTGAEKFGGPVVIQASVQGTARDSDTDGKVRFNSQRANQRAALLLSRGFVYVAFASFCDNDPYHGWVLGYNASTLQLAAVFNTTPNGERGGIWQAGGGLSADSDGNIYAVTGNGTFDADLGGVDFGDSVLKLSPNGGGLTLADFFTPFNQASLELRDKDLGSGGALLLPDQPGTAHSHLAVAGGKDGVLYLLDRDNLGRFHAGDDSQIVQSFLVSSHGIVSTPAFWENHLYILGKGEDLKSFRVSDGRLSDSPTSRSGTVFGYPGATPAISSNGSTDGIVWVLKNTPGSPAVLYAYEATDVSRELYNSSQAGMRDEPGPAVKFTVPTVVNGKVYVGTQSQLAVFGFLP